jgi:hypothetical protein
MPREKLTSEAYMSQLPDTLEHFRIRAGYWAVLHIHALGMASGVFQSRLACSWTRRVSKTGHFGTRALIKPMR